MSIFILAEMTRRASCTGCAIAVRNHHAATDVLIEFDFSTEAFFTPQVEAIRDRIARLLGSALSERALPVAQLAFLKGAMVENGNVLNLLFTVRDPRASPGMSRSDSLIEACRQPRSW
jgi:hypothetical protein